MPWRMSCGAAGLTDDDRKDAGASGLAVTAASVARWAFHRPRGRMRYHCAPRRQRVTTRRRDGIPPRGTPCPMTSFRGRPTGTRARIWDDRERRSMLLNIGFGLTILAALLLLIIAFAASWYDDHLAAAGSVNGQTITKDEFNTQLGINTFRTDYAERRIRTLLTAGQIRSADAQARIGVLDQRQQQAGPIALEQLIDGRIMGQLATDQGVSVTDADVDARFAEEATTPERRHAWMIAVEPTVAEGKTEPHDAAIAAAKA